MERINFQVIEKKWQKRFESQKLYNKNDKAKKFYCLRCFLTRQEKYIWAM